MEKKKAFPRWALAAAAAAMGVVGAISISAATPASGWKIMVLSIMGGSAMAVLAWLLTSRRGREEERGKNG